MKKIEVFLIAVLFSVTNCYGTEMEENYFSEANENIVTFEIDLTYGNIAFDVYNNDTGIFIEKLYLSPNKKTYRYAKGLNLKLVETTSASSYEKINDIYLNDESKIIKFERKLKRMNITFVTRYRSYGKYYKPYETNSNVTIYDEGFNEIGTCKSDGNCEYVLDYGIYFVKDNESGYTSKELIKNDRIVNVTRYLINGILTDEEITIENTTRIGKLYYFDSPSELKKITINDETCNLGDASKYYYINGEGLFYKYSKKDEVINKDNEENKDLDNNNNNNNNNNNSTGEENNNGNSTNDNEKDNNNDNDLKDEDLSNEENVGSSNDNDNKTTNESDNNKDLKKKDNEDNNEDKNDKIGYNDEENSEKDSNISSEGTIIITIPNTEISLTNLIYFKNKACFEEEL